MIYSIARIFALACFSGSSWCATSGTALAQLPDLVDVSAQYMPGADLEDPRPAEAQVTSYDVNVNLPLPLGEQTFLIPGLAYHVDSVSFSDAPRDFTALRAFHSLDVPFLFVQLLPNQWALSLRLAPGLAGDFESFDSGLLRINAVALASHSFGDTFVLGGGGMLTYSFGSLLPLPAIYLEWKPFEHARIEAFIPAFIHAKYTFGDRVEVGMRAEVNGNAYAVRDARIADAWPCDAEETNDPETAPDESVAEPSECFDHVAYSVITAGPTVAVRIIGTFWGTAFVGHSLFRRFEQMNEDDDRITGGVQDLPNVLFFRLGLVWRIPSGS